MKIIYEYKNIDDNGDGVLIRVYDTEEVKYHVYRYGVIVDGIFVSRDEKGVLTYE